MKKIKITILTLFIVSTCIVHAENKIGLTQEAYIKLCGVWELTKRFDIESQFSWGKGKMARNGSIVIDLGEEPPIIFAGPMGESTINRIFKDKKENNKYIIRIHFRDNNNYDLKVSLFNNGIIIFDKMEWFKEIPLLLDDYGSDKKYYKIDGPKIKYYKPKIINLRLREYPSINSNIIRLLNQDESLLIIKQGKPDSIENKKGNWVKVLTDKNEIGWCFDSYLESL